MARIRNMTDVQLLHALADEFSAWRFDDVEEPTRRWDRLIAEFERRNADGRSYGATKCACENCVAAWPAAPEGASALLPLLSR